MIQQLNKSECNLRLIIATMQLNAHKLNITHKMTFGKLKDHAQTMNNFAENKINPMQYIITEL